MEAYTDTDLWIKIDLDRIYSKEVEIARLLYRELDDKSIENEDIKGVQLVRIKGRSIAIVYCRNLEVKGELLAVGQLTVQGQLLQIVSYTRAVYQPPERVSIHGIPLHISNAEVSEWISERVDIVSPIQYAYKIEGNIRINSGNRFLYGNVKEGVIFPRYNVFTTSDPFDRENLIDIDTTIYINSQPINCPRCKVIGHTGRECETNRRSGRLQN
ncbi:unnamed protein product, partial [Owenia fusiformis]